MSPSSNPRFTQIQILLESLPDQELNAEARHAVQEALDLVNELAAITVTETEAAQLRAEAQAANQAKSKFVSVVTHELRLPMTSIKGYTDLLRQGAIGPVNEQQLHFLNVIRNNVDRMSALVSDLSDISRIETGRLKLETGAIDLAQSINESVESLAPLLAEKRHRLEVSLGRELPPVSADPNRVIQVLTNVLSNALKYTPEEGTIHLRAQAQDGMVQVEIEDTGIGISTEDCAKLFTQFFRSEDPAVREQPGWGLGLSVAHQLVELMGGKMGAASTQGAGSTFWFTLPVASQA